MSKNTKKILLLANMLLLILVCFVAVKMVNGRASEIAGERMARICQQVVTGLDAGTMTLASAASFASEESKVGNYVPDVRIVKAEADVILETNDSALTTDLLSAQEAEFVKVNCTRLVAS